MIKLGSAIGVLVLGIICAIVGILIWKVNLVLCIFLAVLGLVFIVLGFAPLLKLWTEWQDIDWDC